MPNRHYKKRLPFLLSILFSLAVFIGFTLTASASIATDLKDRLGLSIPTTSLYQVQEIPEELDIAQRAKVIDGIVADPYVALAVPAVNDSSLALDKATAGYNGIVNFLSVCKSATGAIDTTLSSCQTDSQFIFFKKELDTAKLNNDTATKNLVQALVKARANQDPVIAGMIPESQAVKVVGATISSVATSKETFSGGAGEVSNTDIGQQSLPTGVNPANVSASVQKKIDNDKFLSSQIGSSANSIESSTATGGTGDLTQNIFTTEKDALAVQMHSACSPLEGIFMPCIAEFVYYTIYKPASFLLAGAGMIFDFILMLSIDNSKAMVVPSFVDEAWTVVRDFSNMLFIFVLLYTGIMTMFGKADAKKVIVKVVVIALLINFSLFFTKVVIDAGNVLAVGIKSSLPNESLSAGLVDSFKPQMFLSAAVNADKGNQEPLNAIIVFIIAAIVSGFAAYYFFKAALLFFGRLLGFWFLMIVSPFVFVSTTLPAGDQLGKWFRSLLGLTFAAPVFLFLIYLLTMVISAGGGIMGSFSKTGTGWFNSLLGPVMAATLVILALKKILDITKEMTDVFGEIGAKMVNVAMTGAMGVSGIVARQTLGRGAAAMLRNAPPKSEEELAKMSTFDRKVYEGSRSLLRGASKSSFDVRNIGDKNSLISKTISGKIFQSDQGLGGRVKVAENEAKGLEDKIKNKGLNIFEEESIRKSPEVAQKAAEENLKKAEKEKEEAKQQVAVEEDILKATKESGKAQLEALKNLEASAKEAEARAERDKGSVYEAESKAEASRLRGELEVARKTYNESPTATAIKTAENKVAEAKTKLAKKEKEAKEAGELVKGTNEAKASFAIKNVNKQAKEAILVEAEKGTWFGAGVEKTAVAKVRKEKESSADFLKKALEKQVEESGGSKPKKEEKGEDDGKH